MQITALGQTDTDLVYKGKLHKESRTGAKLQMDEIEKLWLKFLVGPCVVLTLTMSVEVKPKLMTMAVRVRRLRALLFSWIQQQKFCSAAGVHLNSSARAISSSSM